VVADAGAVPWAQALPPKAVIETAIAKARAVRIALPPKGLTLRRLTIHRGFAGASQRKAQGLHGRQGNILKGLG